ncbi:MAG: hypothetical protein KF823_06920 [Xanthomonadales bacterium]|nr:hypothetical protein [Xanthomonadales bacterium]
MIPSPPDDDPAFLPDFLDFLTRGAEPGCRVAGHELREDGLACFNAALHSISPRSPGLVLDQLAMAAQRALDNHPDGSRPAFVSSRLASLSRLQVMREDSGWLASAALAAQLDAIAAYAADPRVLLPASMPVVGRLDEAILADVMLQRVGDELAEYEDYCRLRQDTSFAGGQAALRPRRVGAEWLEGLVPTRLSRESPGSIRRRPAPDPRASLFQVL